MNRRFLLYLNITLKRKKIKDRVEEPFQKGHFSIQLQKKEESTQPQPFLWNC